MTMTTDETSYATIRKVELWIRGPVRYGNVLAVLRREYKVEEAGEKIIIECQTAPHAVQVKDGKETM